MVEVDSYLRAEEVLKGLFALPNLSSTLLHHGIQHRVRTKMLASSRKLVLIVETESRSTPVVQNATDYCVDSCSRHFHGHLTSREYPLYVRPHGWLLTVYFE